MTKTTKTMVSLGCVAAVLIGCCALCLIAGAMHDDDPNAAVAPLQLPPSPASANLDGRYACLTLSILVGGGGTQVQWNPAALPPFTITGDDYGTATGSGGVSERDGVVTFTGGPYDGWRGVTHTNTTGFYLLFNGAEHAQVRSDGARRGDFECFRQKD